MERPSQNVTQNHYNDFESLPLHKAAFSVILGFIRVFSFFKMIIVLRRQWVLSAIFFLTFPICVNCQHSSDEYLALGNNALSKDANAKAVNLYEKGIAALQDTGESLITIISLETNLATAYSAMGGKDSDAMEHYEKAIKAYHSNHEEIENEKTAEDAKAIVSQTAFFYGMELQETNAKRAVEMYGYAVKLDPNLWSAWANLGASRKYVKVMFVKTDSRSFYS